MLNPSFLEYGIPRSTDITNPKTIIVESIDPEGPFGAKDAGEPPVHVGPAAIANAVYNAVGIRTNEVPMTPEKILRAMEQKKRDGR